MIPTDAVVKQATLELFCTSVGFADEEIRRPWDVGAYEFLADWREGSGKTSADLRDGATLKTKNGQDAWPTGSPTSAAGKILSTVTVQGPDRRWYMWSLDPVLVTDWIAGRRPNYGLLVWGKAPGKAVSFASRENTTVAQRPIMRLRLGNVGNIDGLINIQRLDAAKQNDERQLPHEPIGLGVTRDRVVMLFQSVDPKIKLERSPAILGTPLYVGNGSTLNVNIAGPSEDVVEVSVIFDATKGEPKDWVKSAALKPLLLLLQPDWHDALDWLTANMPKAKQHQFKEITTERRGIVTRIESVRSDLVVGVETKTWRDRKAPD